MDNKETEPPENYKLLRVTPTFNDLYNANPYMRACKINESYDSVAHYLDVQFRLLREDFIAPLRRGMTQYLDDDKGFKNNDLRIYKDVKLVKCEINHKYNNVGIYIFFGVLENEQWEDSKLFTPGGLLLLSSNNFDSIIFATILKTDKKKLKQGYILISPVENTVLTPKMCKATYTMLEPKIYFEPYKAVLTALQLMDETQFPMKTYLVSANKTSRLPRYLLNESLFSNTSSTWQVSLKNRLNSSQYNALEHALSDEFAVIQGPPGTGKTFIALEIVTSLLQNKDQWIDYGPIIIVCYTNHALDQFLEGVLKYTKSIIRLGERSNSKELQPYTFKKQKELATKNRHPRDGNARARRKFSEVKRIVDDYLSYLSEMQCVIDCLTVLDAIVPLNCLTRFFYDETLQKMKSDEDLVEWLIGEKLNPVFQQIESLYLDNQYNDEMTAAASNEKDVATLEATDGLTYPFQHIDSKLEMINKRMYTLAQTIDMKNPDTYYYEQLKVELNQWESLKNKLVNERENLRIEFLKHPIRHSAVELSENDRWATYWNWVLRSYNEAAQSFTGLKSQYDSMNSELNEAKRVLDLEILKKHKIIGVTTTAAARLQLTLNELHAPIVIVEEAAEILESHVVCSLSKDCQHLILIGDHKQLRPKPSDYRLGKDFNLEISLFERMVKIRGSCNQLTTQHRMRPEIAKLLTPSIYTTLDNHESVYDFPSVKGVEKNLFFLNHENSEQQHRDESWTNEHEVKFLIMFARHLVMQGYASEDITVLSTYVGQMLELKKQRNKFSILENLYITTVDNYQGEENRIILLSLVRNNGEGKIGFLKEENRVCVALSRAREGLYIMGNIDDLVVENKIWPKLKKVLEDQEALGESLTLECQNHPEQKINVKNSRDFLLHCPDGGCLEICNFPLNCEHTCSSYCHVLDKEHRNYRCKQSCLKSCPEGHPCPLKCWEDCQPCEFGVKCTLKCGHVVEKPCFVDLNDFKCNFKVKAILPDCKHEIEKHCFFPIENCECTYLCEYRVERCGHACVLNCHVDDPDHLEYKCQKDCNKLCENQHSCKKLCYQDCGPCTATMTKERSCGHFYINISCSIRIEEKPCQKPCKLVLNCGHNCRKKCWEPCGNCPEKMNKVSTCGHEVSVKCSEDATPDKCNGPCQKKLQICGHPCKERCKDPCTTKCEAKVELDQPGLCGHVLSVPCYLRDEDPKSPALLKYCEEPCKTQLQCEHLCGGTCGQCLQGRVHVQCMEPCSKILICGHECSIPCREECQPCQKPCETKCVHSKCNKKCGAPCGLCNEPCSVGCEHKKCTQRCYQECNVGPCNEPCKKLLKCKHPCVGFCGEPCPPLCRICDKDELTEIFFGNEDEPDARFVCIGSCKNKCCIESKGLTQWMESSDQLLVKTESIGFKRCPRCNSLITDCMRILNQIKKHQFNVMLVKKEIFSRDCPDLIDKQEKLVNDLKEMRKNELVSEFRELDDLLQKMLNCGSLVNEAVSKKKKLQRLNIQEIDAFKVKLEILQQLIETISLIKNENTSLYGHVQDQAVLIINSIPGEWLVTKQNLYDIQLELSRLQYLVEVCNKTTNQIEFHSIFEKVMGFKQFTKEYEKELICEMEKLNLNIKLEREMIHKAMNLNQGHWFKCPNGHIYVITECGGAMEEGRCNECNATIGGSNHQLLSSNTLASEMDGATRHAWPGGLY